MSGAQLGFVNAGLTECQHRPEVVVRFFSDVIMAVVAVYINSCDGHADAGGRGSAGFGLEGGRGGGGALGRERPPRRLLQPRPALFVSVR